MQALGAALLSDPPPLPMDSHERRKLIEEIRCGSLLKVCCFQKWRLQLRDNEPSPALYFSCSCVASLFAAPSPATAASLLSSFVLTPQDLCSSSSFWLLFMMLFFSWQSVLVAAYMWKIVPFVFIHHASVSSYVDTPDLNVAPTLTDGLQSWQSVTDLHLSTIGAVAGALCVAGRLVWGYVGNKAGNKRALVSFTCTSILMEQLGVQRSCCIPSLYSFWQAWSCFDVSVCDYCRSL